MTKLDLTRSAEDNCQAPDGTHPSRGAFNRTKSIFQKMSYFRKALLIAGGLHLVGAATIGAIHPPSAEQIAEAKEKRRQAKIESRRKEFVEEATEKIEIAVTQGVLTPTIAEKVKLDAQISAGRRAQKEEINETNLDKKALFKAELRKILETHEGFLNLDISATVLKIDELDNGVLLQIAAKAQEKIPVMKEKGRNLLLQKKPADEMGKIVTLMDIYDPPFNYSRMISSLNEALALMDVCRTKDGKACNLMNCHTKMYGTLLMIGNHFPHLRERIFIYSNLNHNRIMLQTEDAKDYYLLEWKENLYMTGQLELFSEEIDSNGKKSQIIPLKEWLLWWAGGKANEEMAAYVHQKGQPTTEQKLEIEKGNKQWSILRSSDQVSSDMPSFETDATGSVEHFMNSTENDDVNALENARAKILHPTEILDLELIGENTEDIPEPVERGMDIMSNHQTISGVSLDLRGVLSPDPEKIRQFIARKNKEVTERPDSAFAQSVRNSAKKSFPHFVYFGHTGMYSYEAFEAALSPTSVETVIFDAMPNISGMDDDKKSRIKYRLLANKDKIIRIDQKIHEGDVTAMLNRVGNDKGEVHIRSNGQDVQLNYADIISLLNVSKAKQIDIALGIGKPSTGKITINLSERSRALIHKEIQDLDPELENMRVPIKSNQALALIQQDYRNIDFIDASEAILETIEQITGKPTVGQEVCLELNDNEKESLITLGKVYEYCRDTKGLCSKTITQVVDAVTERHIQDTGYTWINSHYDQWVEVRRYTLAKSPECKKYFNDLVDKYFCEGKNQYRQERK